MNSSKVFILQLFSIVYGLSTINLKKEMKIMFVLIGSSFVLAIGFLIAFIWMVKNGQIDDDYTPSVRMLFDDGTVKKQDEEKV
jgi:cbb3-type cytochrome oxidase maturation protein